MRVEGREPAAEAGADRTGGELQLPDPAVPHLCALLSQVPRFHSSGCGGGKAALLPHPTGPLGKHQRMRGKTPGRPRPGLAVCADPAPL